MRVKTQEEFIKQCISVHGSTYDYSLARYIGNKKKITIICTTHGAFTQTPDAHIRGQGCPNCVINLGRPTESKYSTIGFIEEACKVHSNLYDYTFAECSGSLSMVHIICRKHGKFLQTANVHLAGRGCPMCAKEFNSLRGANTLAEVAKISALKAGALFVDKAVSIHGILYNYDKIDYINNHTKVVIVCREHGDFLQRPLDHLSGKGCPECAKERRNIAMRMSEKNDRPTMLYYIHFPEVNLWKIGCTSRALTERFSRESLKHEVLETKEYTSGNEAYRVEKFILDATNRNKYNGEILLKGGNSELRTQPIESFNYLVKKAEAHYNSFEEDYINH